jgi:hypothetical protein
MPDGHHYFCAGCARHYDVPRGVAIRCPWCGSRDDYSRLEFPMPDEKKLRVLRFRYLNYRGESAERRVRPLDVWCGSLPEHHGDEPHWFLRAHCLDRGATRDFRLDRMTEIREEQPTGPADAPS